MARRRLLKSYFYIVYDGVAYGETVNVLPFDETGGTDSFKVVTNRSWTVVSCPSWATLSVNGGVKGETDVTITAGPNEGTASKTGQIIVRTLDGRYTGYLNISQMGTEAYIHINGGDSDVSTTVPFRDESEVYSISTRGGWTLVMTGPATASTTDYDGPGTINVTISYAKNSTNADKTYVATLTSKEDPTLVRTITITHKAQSEIDLTYSAHVIPYTGETGTIGVGTNIGGNFDIPASVQSQIALSKMTGLEDGDTVSYTAVTLDPTQSAETSYEYVISAKTIDYQASDEIDWDSVALIYEAYPNIIISTANTIGSAITAGSLPYVTNYPVQLTNASQDLTVILNGSNVDYSLPQNASWSDVSYTFDITTIPYSSGQPDGVRGPVVTKTVTITREANVAYIDAQNASAPSAPGTYYVDVDTNDTFSVSIDPSATWITLDRIDGNRVYFNVTENTGTDARTAPITFTTTHDGPGGEPASKTISFTQSAPGTTVIPVTMNVDLYQDSDGDWYIDAAHSEQGVALPVTFVYGGNSTALTVTNTPGTPISTPWNTAAGTPINTANIGYTTAVTIGNNEYDITCVYNVTEYSEEVEITDYDFNLSYDIDEIPASGGTSEPTLEVTYTAVTTPSFGEPTTSVTTETITDFSLDGDDENGTINSDGSISADSRGTNEGDEWEAATITAITGTVVINGVEYELTGESQSGYYTVDQEENKIIHEDWTQTASTTEWVNVEKTGQTPTVYSNVEVEISPNEGYIDATGGSIENITATETYDESYTDEITYDEKTTTDYDIVYTYTSLDTKDSATTESKITETGLTGYGETHETTGLTNDITDLIEVDDEYPCVYLSYSYDSSEGTGTVTGENLHKTPTEGETLVLTVTSEKDSEATATAAFEQEANVGTPGEPYDVVTYAPIGVWFETSEDETEFRANGLTEGGNDGISVEAYESGNVTTTTYVVITYTTGEEDPIVSAITTTTYRDDVTETIGTSTPNRVDLDTSDYTAHAPNLGTTEYGPDSLSLSAWSTHDSTVWGTIDITQEGNQVENTGWTETTPITASTTCSLDVNESDIMFTNDKRTFSFTATCSSVTVVNYIYYPTSSYTSGDVYTGDTPDTASTTSYTEYNAPDYQWSDLGDLSDIIDDTNISITSTSTPGIYNITVEAAYAPFEYIDSFGEGIFDVGLINFTSPDDCLSTVQVSVDLETPQNDVGWIYDVTAGETGYVSVRVHYDYQNYFVGEIQWSTEFDYSLTVRDRTTGEETPITGHATITGTGGDADSIDDSAFDGPTTSGGDINLFEYLLNEDERIVYESPSIDNVSTTYTFL